MFTTLATNSGPEPVKTDKADTVGSKKLSPGVAGVRKLSGLEALWSAPRKRNLLPLGHDVAVVLLRQRAHQPEVADLDFVDGGQEDVPASQVPVNEPLAFQVGHALGDLDGEVPDHVDGHMRALK